MSNIEVKDKAQPTGQNNNSAAELAKKTYATGSIFKTILKITFPVFILMIVNSLYQMVDTIMAAQMVDYGADVFGESSALSGHFMGSIAAQYIMPLVMLALAMSVLINVGYGTMFSQKMGAGDVEGAKSATSTALWATFILGMFTVIFGVIFGPMIIRANIPNSYFEGNLSELGETIYRDSQMTCFIYLLAIFLSGFQGVVSRQLRAEGHIKSMSYLPLIAIPFNVLFDWVFMGPMDMEVTGAAIATLISMGITSLVTYAYAISARKKEKTLFSFTAFNGGINYKILIPIFMIGLVPFFMQALRIYDIELASQLIKHFVEDIPVPNTIIGTTPIDVDGTIYNVSNEIIYKLNEMGSWSTFFTAAMRPMMLIMMPGVAVLQAGSAFLGYNYGAKNYHRVNKGILVMIAVMLMYAFPSWVLLLILSKYVLVWFGAQTSYDVSTWGDYGQDMINIHRIIIALGITNCFVMAPNAYVISTKRFKAGLSMQVINLVVVYTIVIFTMFYIFKGQSNYPYFYTYNAIFTAASAIVASIMLGTILFFDHKKLKKEGHVDTH